MPLAHIPTAWYVFAGISAAFAIIFPFALGLYLRRLLGVGWRYFWFGVAVFAVFQLLTRVPAVLVGQTLLGKQIAASIPLQWAWLTLLALTAGIFEEVGRYVGYRVFMGKEEKTWAKGVMYGAGHGGIESITLAGIAGALSIVSLLAYQTLDLAKLPEAQQTAIVQGFATVAAQPVWLPLLGFYERLGAITFHIAMSVVVLQVFRRRQMGWLWLAVALHAVFDFVAAGLPLLLKNLGAGLDMTTTTLLVEGWVTIGALFSLWLIFRLRDHPTGEPAAAAQAQPLAS